MESMVNLMRGVCRVRVSGANPENFLNNLSENGVTFWNAIPVDDYTIELSVRRADVGQLEPLAQRSMCGVELLSKRGMPYFLRRLRKRYTLLAGLGICVFALLCSSLFIWDIEVLGNREVGTAEILGALEEIGIGIGSYWPAFTSDRIRSELLLRVPELSFLTVNVYGSHAEVIVRERVPKPEIVKEEVTADIYADKTGIISDMSVLRGTAAVAAGKTVMAGDLLVKGEFVDLQSTVRRVRAMADVTLRTWHELVAVGSKESQVKSYTGKRFANSAIIAGNFRLNLYFGSGNRGMTCDKIVEETPVAFQDVFTLPFTLVRERYQEYETMEVPADLDRTRRRLEIALMDSLAERIGEDGKIVTSAYSYAESGGLIYVTLRAECLEKTGVTIEG